MILYRVEQLNGEGPYQFPCLIYNDYDNAASHPLPTEDGIPYDKITPYHYFAFTSINGLKSWFCDRIRKHLYDHKCRVYVYDCPEDRVLIGYSQVAFVRDASQYVKTLDIINFLEISC